MITGDKDFGYALTCDECDTVEDGFDTFAEAVDRKREGEWHSVKDADGNWHDLCPECYEKWCKGLIKF